MYEILKDINSPDDVKKLNMEELKVLANDIRDGLFNRLTKIGGHFGPNFGMYLIHQKTNLFLMYLIKVIHTKC